MGRQNSPLFSLIIIVLLVGTILYAINPEAFDDIIPGEGIKGGAGIALTVYYTDGDSAEYDFGDRPPWVGLGLVPLTIEILDKPIDSVDARIKYKANWEGSITSYTFSGNLYFYVDDVAKYTWSVTNPGSISKNSYQDILSQTVTAGTLESWAGEDGDHTIKLEASLTLAITFADGTSDTKTATDSVQIGFEKVPATTVTGSSITLFDMQSYVPVDFT